MGLLSTHDKFHEHQKQVVGPKKKLIKEQKKLEKKKAKLKKIKETAVMEANVFGQVGHPTKPIKTEPGTSKPAKAKKFTPEQMANKRRKIFTSIAKKEVPKQAKQKASARKEMMSQLKKVSCSKILSTSINIKTTSY